MSATLFITKTPKRIKDEIGFKIPLRDSIRDYFNVGSGRITIYRSDKTVAFFEGLLAAQGSKSTDKRDLEKVIDMIEDRGSIDMWIEYG